MLILSQSLFLTFVRLPILNNVCVLYVGVCVGALHAFVRIFRWVCSSYLMLFGSDQRKKQATACGVWEQIHCGRYTEGTFPVCQHLL